MNYYQLAKHVMTDCESWLSNHDIVRRDQLDVPCYLFIFFMCIFRSPRTRKSFVNKVCKSLSLRLVDADFVLINLLSRNTRSLGDGNERRFRASVVRAIFVGRRRSVAAAPVSRLLGFFGRLAIHGSSARRARQMSAAHRRAAAETARRGVRRVLLPTGAEQPSRRRRHRWQQRCRSTHRQAVRLGSVFHQTRSSVATASSAGKHLLGAGWLKASTQQRRRPSVHSGRNLRWASRFQIANSVRLGASIRHPGQITADHGATGTEASPAPRVRRNCGRESRRSRRWRRQFFRRRECREPGRDSSVGESTESVVRRRRRRETETGDAGAASQLAIQLRFRKRRKFSHEKQRIRFGPGKFAVTNHAFWLAVLVIFISGSRTRRTETDICIIVYR